MKEGGTKNNGSNYIRFRCKYCGHKIKIAKEHAGKKGKCPACKKYLIIPTIQTKDVPPKQERPLPKNAQKSPLSDIDLLDLPKKEESTVAASPAPGSEKPSPDPLETGIISRSQLFEKPESPKQRSLPAVIDIFLYPLNKPGLTVVGVIFGSLLVLSALQYITWTLSIVFMPLLVGYFLVFYSGIFIKFVLFMYLVWYFCECIRDSAEGNIRAPETVATTPGIGELFWLTLKIVGCIVLLLLPALIYLYHTHNTDIVFWSLFGIAGFLMPMGILAITMFDSISALNPVFIVGSILSTFFQYTGLIICIILFSIVATGLLFVLGLIITFASLFAFGGFLLFLPGFIISYNLLLTGHLLGRFYWRYEEKLKWGV